MTVNLEHNKGDEIMQKYRRFFAWIGLILGLGIITIHIPAVQHFLVSHASERASQQVTRKNVTHNAKETLTPLKQRKQTRRWNCRIFGIANTHL